MEAYAQLVKQGKLRAIGASNYQAERLSAALRVSAEHGDPRYETLQPLFNIYDREPYETKLEPVCVQHGLGVIPYFSLASRLSHRQVPIGGRSREKPTRTGSEEVFERAGIPHSGGA